jgi:hypothetical protein
LRWPGSADIYIYIYHNHMRLSSLHRGASTRGATHWEPSWHTNLLDFGIRILPPTCWGSLPAVT